MEKGVNNMIEDIEGFRLPRYAQIPNVGLHLEQVVRYVNTHLAPCLLHTSRHPLPRAAHAGFFGILCSDVLESVADLSGVRCV